jgi:hypothetical protein
MIKIAFSLIGVAMVNVNLNSQNNDLSEISLANVEVLQSKILSKEIDGESDIKKIKI